MGKSPINKAASSTGSPVSKRKQPASHETVSMTIDTTDLPAVAQQAIAEVLRIVASGGTPLVTGENEFLTTTEAAQILNVTRPTIINWIDEGKLSSHMVGTHRRLLTSEVHELRTQVRKRQLSALESLLNL